MRPTATQIELGGETYWADLPLGAVRAIEDIAGEGIFRVLGGFYAQRKAYRWEVIDGAAAIVEDLVPDIGAKSAVIREVIRAGLVGGGMSATEALKLVRRHVDDRPLSEAAPVALRILSALAYGAPEDAATANPRTAAETDASTSPPSTAAQPSPA